MGSLNFVPCLCPLFSLESRIAVSIITTIAIIIVVVVIFVVSDATIVDVTAAITVVAFVSRTYYAYADRRLLISKQEFPWEEAKGQLQVEARYFRPRTQS